MNRALQQIWQQERVLATLRQTPEFEDVSGVHLLQFIEGIPVETELEERIFTNLGEKLLVCTRGQYWAERTPVTPAGGQDNPSPDRDVPDSQLSSSYLGTSGVFNLDNVLLASALIPATPERMSLKKMRMLGPAEFVQIDKSRVRELYAKSDVFRRAVRKKQPEPAPSPSPSPRPDQRGKPTRPSRRLTLSAATVSPQALTQTVLFDSPPEGPPLVPLLQRLASRIGSDFQQRVLILEPGAPTQPQRVSPTVHVATGDDPSPYEGDFDYIFLGTPTRGNPLKPDRVVSLTGRLPEPADWTMDRTGQPERLDTVLLQSLSSQPDGALVMMPDAYATQSGGGYSACWLDLGWDDLESLASTRALSSFGSETSRRLEDALGRWARAVAHRRVGLALSGGGSWGFRHVAIIRMLTALGVPIDMVSGASIGAVVAAYYGARGMDGLEALLSLTRGWALRLTQLASLATNLPLQWLLTQDLGRRSLHELSTRCLPVATNLAEGLSHLVFNGRLSQAIALCASPPGLTPSVPVTTRRYVDGAIMNDLPASVLTTFGADFTLAVNCYPLAMQGLASHSPGFLEAFLQGLDPLRRFWDLLCSGDLMLFVNGNEQGRVANLFIDDRQGMNGPPFEEPLSEAADFSRAQQVIDTAMNDPALRSQVERFATRWRALQAPASLMPA
ncbi:MAG: patatin-like phospholipase family protein, partial [Archangium sp.]